MEPHDLPTTTYIVLGLLTFREMSGYDLKILADQQIKHFYWSPAKSQIYGELRRLESHGFVTMREVLQQQRPDKRLYRITPRGQEAMRQWLESTDISPDSYKSEFLLKLFFGHLWPREKLVTQMEVRRQQLSKDLQAWEARASELAARMQGTAEDETILLPLLTVQLTLAHTQATLAWAEHALDDLQRQSPQAPKAPARKKAPAKAGSTQGARTRKPV